MELQTEVLQGNDYYKIAKWAFQVYKNHELQLEDGLEEMVLKISFMEEGPGFIISNEDLLILANKLINE